MDRNKHLQETSNYTMLMFMGWIYLVHGGGQCWTQINIVVKAEVP
jgi:hypothetical protein